MHDLIADKERLMFGGISITKQWLDLLSFAPESRLSFAKVFTSLSTKRNEILI